MIHLNVNNVFTVITSLIQNKRFVNKGFVAHLNVQFAQSSSNPVLERLIGTDITQPPFLLLNRRSTSKAMTVFSEPGGPSITKWGLLW